MSDLTERGVTPPGSGPTVRRVVHCLCDHSADVHRSEINEEHDWYDFGCLVCPCTEFDPFTLEETIE